MVLCQSEADELGIAADGGFRHVIVACLKGEAQAADFIFGCRYI